METSPPASVRLGRRPKEQLAVPEALRHRLTLHDPLTVGSGDSAQDCNGQAARLWKAFFKAAEGRRR